jgi:hypothetical protein
MSKMKIRNNCSTLLTLLYAVFLIAFFVSPPAWAQSGRVVPTPQPTPQITPPHQPAANSKPGPGPSSGEKYKLVFTTGYDGKLTYVRGEDSEQEIDLTRHAAYDSFIEEINKAGAQGYRLVTSVDRMVAILKPDEAQYEYAWFETASTLEHRKGGFLGTYTRLAKQGFRLAEHSLIYRSCKSPDFEAFNYSESCEYRDFFLLERRRQGVESAREPRLVYSGTRNGWERHEPHADMMTADVKEALSAGFYPTAVLSRFEILVEQLTEQDEALADKSGVRVVRSSSFWERDNLPEKVNELGRQGYRLALIKNGIAVMSRQGESAAPVTYVWLKTKDKSFEKQLAKLQAGGAAYRMVYPDRDGDETKLVFEQKPVDDRQRREYRVLRLELHSAADSAEKKVRTDLAPSSKETMRAFDQLVKEGFDVRALFISGDPKLAGKAGGRFVSEKYGILLERIR